MRPARTPAAGSISICACELCQALLGLAAMAVKNQQAVLRRRGRLAVIITNTARSARGDPPR